MAEGSASYLSLRRQRLRKPEARLVEIAILRDQADKRHGSARQFGREAREAIELRFRGRVEQPDNIRCSCGLAMGTSRDRAAINS